MSKIFLSFTLIGVFIMMCSLASGQETRCACRGNAVYFGKLADADPSAPPLSAFPEMVRKGLNWLKSADLSKLPKGRGEIEGKDLYYIMEEYESRPLVDIVVESHRKYVDIQLVLEGREQIGTLLLDPSFPISKEYNPEKDIVFYPETVMPFLKTKEETRNRLIMNAGNFAIFTPNDLHAGCLQIDQPEKVRKIIIKCKIAD
ncbi:MAG: YhcH/YjgK/YiaL family protein [Planctomycetia bacterium]|nr:YhcH/YjgK/YiaL family protein [Planctomycetia bacterium]